MLKITCALLGILKGMLYFKEINFSLILIVDVFKVIEKIIRDEKKDTFLIS